MPAALAPTRVETPPALASAALPVDKNTSPLPPVFALPDATETAPLVELLEGGAVGDGDVGDLELAADAEETVLHLRRHRGGALVCNSGHTSFNEC